MKDADLEAYVAEIEAHLGRLRGREHVLTPPDFELARRWHAQMLPLAAVLAGIDQAAARGDAVATLRYCRRDVEHLARGDAAHAADATARSDGGGDPPGRS